MPFSTPCHVLPSAPGVSPLTASASVAIEPGTADTSGAGSTTIGSLRSGMFLRYETSAPMDTPAICLARLMP
jgi:hypothetical protein